MPQIPNVSLSPTPRSGLTSGPGVIQYQDTSMQKFSALGQGIQKLGQVATAWARKAEDEINDTRTMEATNAYEFSANKLVLEWRAKKGQDAINSREDLEKQLSEVRESSLGMLDNDVQRNQFVRVAGKISNRANLSIESYYLEAAAQGKQSQLETGHAILADSIISGDSDITDKVVDMGRFAAVSREMGIGLGFSDEPLNPGEPSPLDLFVQQKNDKLLTSMVAAAVDSDDGSQMRGMSMFLDASEGNGTISETVRDSLKNLLDDKSGVLEAGQWAAATQSYASGFAEAKEMFKTDPPRAARMMEALGPFYSTQEAAQANERGELARRIKGMVARGEKIPVELEVEAKKQGVWPSIQALRRDQGVTSPFGKKQYLEFVDRPEVMRRRWETVGAMVNELDSSLNDDDMETLVRQYSQGGATPGSGKGGSKTSFGEFDSPARQVAETMLFTLDQVSGSEHKPGSGWIPYIDRLSRGSRDSVRNNYMRTQVINRFVNDVMEQANKMLPFEDGNVDRTNLISRAAKIVYDSGWFPGEGPERVNQYTTMISKWPKTPGDIEEYMGPAASQLKEDRRRMYLGDLPKRVSQARSAAYAESKYAKSFRWLEDNLYQDPVSVPALASVMRQAAKQTVSDVPSLVEIRDRAEDLREEAREDKTQVDTGVREQVSGEIVEKLLSSSVQSINIDAGLEVHYSQKAADDLNDELERLGTLIAEGKASETDVARLAELERARSSFGGEIGPLDPSDTLKPFSIFTGMARAREDRERRYLREGGSTATVNRAHYYIKGWDPKPLWGPRATESVVTERSPLWMTTASRHKINNYMSDPVVLEQRERYLGNGVGTEEEWEALALKYYPGDTEDLPYDFKIYHHYYDWRTEPTQAELYGKPQPNTPEQKEKNRQADELEQALSGLRGRQFSSPQEEKLALEELMESLGRGNKKK